MEGLQTNNNNKVIHPVSSQLAVPKGNPVEQFTSPRATNQPTTATAPLNADAGSFPAQSVPISSANGVNIVIYNPSVQPPNGTSTTNNTYNQMSYPKEYYTQPLASQQAAPVSAPAVAPIAATKVATEEPKKTESKQKEIVQLTDDYIKTLENYIKNPNAEVRLMGVKELQKRFEEDSSRKGDVALNNLLNVALQDKDQKVRFMAMMPLDMGTAQGDALTQQILTQISNSEAVYGTDAKLALDIQLKLAGKKVMVPDNSPANKETKKA